jgi:hypothetical protein
LQEATVFSGLGRSRKVGVGSFLNRLSRFSAMITALLRAGCSSSPAASPAAAVGPQKQPQKQRPEGGTFRGFDDDLEPQWRAFQQCMPPAATLLQTPLHLCSNLAPAGAGSQSITDALAALQTAVLGRGSPSKHHNHFIRYPDLVRLNKGQPPPCVVVPIRDPVDRLASGMRFDVETCRCGKCARHTPLHQLTDGQPLSGLPARIFNSSSRGHAMAMTALRVSKNNPRRLYGRFSVPVHPGNNFLINQLDYLRGLDCNATRLYYVCTERLSADWGALLRSSSYNASTIKASDIKTHAHQRGNASDGELTAMASPDPVAEVQIRKLYHDDVALHRMVCGGGRKTYREFTGAYAR